MINIAENVFKAIADRLLELKLSIWKAFHKSITIIDEFDN